MGGFNLKFRYYPLNPVKHEKNEATTQIFNVGSQLKVLARSKVHPSNSCGKSRAGYPHRRTFCPLSRCVYIFILKWIKQLMIWERTTGSLRISFIISLYQWSKATVANIHLWMPQTVILMSCSKDSVHRANKCSSMLISNCAIMIWGTHIANISLQNLQIIPNPRSMSGIVPSLFPWPFERPSYSYSSPSAQNLWCFWAGFPLVNHGMPGICIGHYPLVI